MTDGKPLAPNMGTNAAAEAEQAGLGTPEAPPAGPPPRARGRRNSAVGASYAILLAGVVLLASVVISSTGDLETACTALAGAGSIALGGALMTEVLGPRLVGAAALPIGLALGISALAPDAIGGAELGRLLGGALLFLGAAGLLAAAGHRPRDAGGATAD